MNQKFFRSIQEPIIRLNTLSYKERWKEEDQGLITCWEIGRKLHYSNPKIAARAKKGELPPLGWKGGARKKKTIEGSFYYLAKWQGLRRENLDINMTKKIELICSKTGHKTTFVDKKKIWEKSSKMNNFIAIDFETANSKRVSACSIGYAIVKNGAITKSNEYLMKPVGGHATFQSKIHGIKEKHTANKPDFKGVFPEIKSLLESPLVGHSLFDKQVLNAMLSHFHIDLTFEYTDSCSSAKKILPDLKNHKLKTLAKHFGLQPFKHHNAEEDAITCAKIFLSLQKADLKEINSKKNDIDLNLETEFFGFIKGVLSDNVINYKEAYELLYYLEDNPMLCKKYDYLYDELGDALDDDHLDESESIQIKFMLENLLKTDN